MIKQLSDAAAFIENFPDIVIIASSSLRILAMNSEGMKVLGYESDGLANLMLSDLLPADCVTKAQIELQKIMGGEAIQCRVPWATKNNEPAILDFSVRPFRIGTERYFLVAGKDATALSKAESDLEKKSQALDKVHQTYATLARNVVHDVVNPLTGILGNLELMARLGINTADGKFYQYLTTSRISGRELQRLILSYHDLNLMETGTLRLQKNRCNLKDMIKNGVDSILWLAEQDNIKVTADVPDSIPEIIADQEILHRVVENLMSAVLRYTREDARITVTLKLNADGSRVAGEILGEGNGIMDATKAEAFAAFFERDGASVEFLRGVNLGVTHAKYALRALHGRLSFANRPGESLSYLFDIPVDGGRWG